MCDQHEREGSSGQSRDGYDVVDQRSWTAAHFSAQHGGTTPQLAGKLPKASFDALTPPQGSASMVNLSGPGGMTVLHVAAMSPAMDAGQYGLMDGLGAQFRSAAIVQDLIADGAATEDRTDFSGVFCYSSVKCFIRLTVDTKSI